MFNFIKFWLMNKYCPEFWFKVPYWDDAAIYQCDVIIIYGYWGNKHRVVKSKTVIGAKNAYYEARWNALVYDFLHPAWLFDIGVNYGITKNENQISKS